MANSQPPVQSLFRTMPIFKLLRKHLLLWMVPTIAFCVLSILYATLGPKKYGATQTLLVRDQLIGGNQVMPGRFESTYSLKSAQETISEIAKQRTVVAQALRTAGLSNTPPQGDPDWPSAKVVEQYQGSISVSSPGGSEFGKTEMIDLVVKAGSRDDALALINALTLEIEARLRLVRRQQAASMVLELSETVRLATQDHERAADKLQQMEAELGADLAELRNLNNPNASVGSMQSQFNNVQNETRVAINERENLAKQKSLLRQAAMAPDGIRATPDEALTFLPALKSLKEGLIKSQLEMAKDLGQYSEHHPKVVASRTEVTEIQQNIARELKTSILAKEKEIEIAQAKVDRLQRTSADLAQRLNRIARLRVDYDKKFNAEQQRNQALIRATDDLNQMISLREASSKVNFVTRVDQPQVGTTPLGLSKKLTVGLGTVFGLCLGLGLVMFIAGGAVITPPPHSDQITQIPPPLAANSNSPASNELESAFDSMPATAESAPLQPEPKQLQPELSQSLRSESLPAPASANSDWGSANQSFSAPKFEGDNRDLAQNVATKAEFDQATLAAAEAIMEERRRRERTRARNESRTHSSQQLPRERVVVPRTPLAETPVPAQEVVIPQAQPLDDEEELAKLLQQAESHSVIQGFEPPELEDIDMESRGSLLQISDALDTTPAAPETTSAPSTAETPQASAPASNIITFADIPPQNGATDEPVQTVEDPLQRFEDPTTDREPTQPSQPIRLQKRTTTDPLGGNPKAAKGQTDSSGKPITQTLVLGTNSLMKMLEEQSRDHGADAKNSTSGPVHSDETTGDPTAQDSDGPVKVDRGSIFSFPMNRSNPPQDKPTP